jgi:hypothetical protein
MKKPVEEILEGTYELVLNNCMLRQRASHAPTVYAGAGLLTQDDSRKLHLRVFSPGIDAADAIERTTSKTHAVGKLVPESAYFDFEGFDQFGHKWVCEYLSLSIDYGSGTYIQARPRSISMTETMGWPSKANSALAYLPVSLELPWHVASPYGNRGTRVDGFSADLGEMLWDVRKRDVGTSLQFTVRSGSVEDLLDHFLRALSIVTGRALRPVSLTIQEGDSRTTRLYAPNDVPIDSLLAPVPLSAPEPRDAHRFLESFLSHAGSKQAAGNGSTLIHRLWHRILRARPSDVENSSLVLSVAIESLLQEALASEQDVDQEFKQQVEDARALLKGVELPPRARDCVLSSFGNALRPKAQSVLRRLIRGHSIGQDHLDAWSGMRNTAAHGASLADDADGFQQHIDRFHACLDLFYRLVFIVIGYKGRHVDFSKEGWPVSDFPPIDASSQSPIE